MNKIFKGSESYHKMSKRGIKFKTSSYEENQLKNLLHSGCRNYNGIFAYHRISKKEIDNENE